MLINHNQLLADRIVEYDGSSSSNQQQRSDGNGASSTTAAALLCNSSRHPNLPGNIVDWLLPPNILSSIPQQASLLSHPLATVLLPPLSTPASWAIPSITVPGQYYNGVNPTYPGLSLVNRHPPIFAVEQFLSHNECDFLVGAAHDSFGPAPVVGKGAGEVSPSRTSSTCYLAREDLPNLLRKVSLLTGVALDQCELPQVGRYLPTQQYLQHCDAFDLSSEDGRRFAANGGQRIVTVLIYLNDVPRGGATRFPLLNDAQFQPRRGSCLVFFPATLDGTLDPLALHAAMPAIDVKYVSQVWIRQSTYQGVPSKRLTQTLGPPLTPAEAEHSRLQRATWEQATAATMAANNAANAAMLAAVTTTNAVPAATTTTLVPTDGASVAAATAAWLLQQMPQSQPPPQLPSTSPPPSLGHASLSFLGTGLW